MKVESASPSEHAPPGNSGDGSVLSSPYRWALVTTLLVGALYAVTLSPTTAFWDTSEYIATARIMGIPHPPGNPLFVVLARAWHILLEPLGLSVAVRINLFSAMMGATAHGLWFLVVHRILSYFSEDRFFRVAGAMAAVLVSATAFTVWNQSNVNEKVYTVSLMTIALLSWLAFHWRENLGKGKDDNLLVGMVFILALSVGNHLMAFLAAPALAAFILVVHPRTLLNWKLYLASGVAVLAGLSIHLFLPIRAGLDPVINETAPSCSSLISALTSIISWGQAGCADLSASLSRSQYDKPPLIPRQAALHSQVANYLQYFDWQWARAVSGADTVFALLRMPFTFLFAGLGVFGAAEHYRRDRPSWIYMLVLFGTLSVALLLYLNFKYGFSLAAPATNPSLHEVRERDYFFIVSFSIWGLWAGIGIAALWARGARRMGGLKMALPILTLAFVPLIANWSWASRRGDFSARDWAYNLLMSVEPYGILFTNGDNDTFPLWYLQEVEEIRQDVTVLVTSYLNTDWYVRQLRQLTSPCPPGVNAKLDPTRIICQREYDTTGRSVYTADPAAAERAGQIPIPLEEPVRAPRSSILDLPDDVIDQVAASVTRLPEDRAFQLGPVVARVRGGTIFFPWHQFALAAINQSLHERPIYFASSGNAPQELGLDRYLVREGLAFRLHPGDLLLERPPGVVEMRPSPISSVVGSWMNVPRTETLFEDVFVHRTGIPDGWSVWPDRATIGIPNYYAWGYYALMQAASQIDDNEAVDRFRERGDAWTDLGN